MPAGAPDSIAEQLTRLLDHPDELNEWKRRSQINIDHLRIDRVAAEALAVYRAAYGRRRGRTLPTDINAKRVVQ